MMTRTFAKALDVAVRALTFAAAAIGAILLLGMTVLPGLLGYKPYTVLSGSMSPSIPTGSVVIAVPVSPSTLRLGDVIMYDHPELHASITHRIVDVQGDSKSPTFRTKGDANGSPDSWTVTYDGAAGKVVLSVPFIGYIYHALGSPQGHLVFLIVPVGVLAAMYLADIWKPKPAAAPPAAEIRTGLGAVDLTPAKLQPGGGAPLSEAAPDRSATLPLRQ